MLLAMLSKYYYRPAHHLEGGFAVIKVEGYRSYKRELE
jgi:hypothetical protein